jgi:hypothetical protein
MHLGKDGVNNTIDYHARFRCVRRASKPLDVADLVLFILGLLLSVLTGHFALVWRNMHLNSKRQL